jgi:DNA primase
VKTFDVSDLKARTDLLALVEADLGPATKQSGRWFYFPCPWHDDGTHDGGSLRVTPDNGKWFCFGCHAHGDALDWIQRRSGGSFVEAVSQLGGQRTVTPRASVSVVQAKDWRGAADRAANAAEQYLWSDGSRLDYLRARGLSDATIRAWHLGYNPGNYRVPEIVNTRGDAAVMMRGWTIPTRVGGEIVALKVRQPDGIEPKYTQLYGSRPALFGADALAGKATVVLTEGEFDAMLLAQEAGDLVGVATTTGGAKTWKREWAVSLLSAKAILLAYDTDQVGEEAAVMMAGELGGRARRVSVPSGKDVTDYWKSGGNLRAWIESLIATSPKPSRSCSICSGTQWQLGAGGSWACAICGPTEPNTAARTLAAALGEETV